MKNSIIYTAIFNILMTTYLHGSDVGEDDDFNGGGTHSEFGVVDIQEIDSDGEDSDSKTEKKTSFDLKSFEDELEELKKKLETNKTSFYIKGNSKILTMEEEIIIKERMIYLEKVIKNPKILNLTQEKKL